MTNALLESLGLTESYDVLDGVFKVRVDQDLLARIDRIEAFMRGHGIRQVTRSSLARAALTGYVEGVEDAIPELTAQSSEETP